MMGWGKVSQSRLCIDLHQWKVGTRDRKSLLRAMESKCVPWHTKYWIGIGD